MDLLLPVFQLLYFVAHFLYSLAESVGNTWRLITQMKAWLHNKPRGTAITSLPLTGASPTLYNALPKIPRHVGIVSASPLVDAASLASVIGWIAAYGVQEVSVHDVHGDLSSRKSDIIEEMEKMDVRYLYRVRERIRDSEGQNRVRDIRESEIRDREREKQETRRWETMPSRENKKPTGAQGDEGEENEVRDGEPMPKGEENGPLAIGKAESEGELAENDINCKYKAESETYAGDSEGTRLVSAESEAMAPESEGSGPGDAGNEVKIAGSDTENERKCTLRPTFLGEKPKSEVTVPESEGDGPRNEENAVKIAENYTENDRTSRFRPSQLVEKPTGTENDEIRPSPPSSSTLRYRPTGHVQPTTSGIDQNSLNIESRPTFTLTFLGLRDGREDLARVAERLAIQYSNSLHSLSGANSQAKSGSLGLKEVKNGDFSLGKNLGGLGSLEKQNPSPNVSSIGLGGVRNVNSNPKRNCIGLPDLEGDILGLSESSVGLGELKKQNLKPNQNSMGLGELKKQIRQNQSSLGLGGVEKQNLDLGTSHKQHSSHQATASIGLPKASNISSLLAMAPLADPELVISLGLNSSLGLFSTLGYPPWRLRASEIHSLGLSEGLAGLQRVMEAYAGCEQRWGK